MWKHGSLQAQQRELYTCLQEKTDDQCPYNKHNQQFQQNLLVKLIHSFPWHNDFIAVYYRATWDNKRRFIFSLFFSDNGIIC